MRRWFLHGGRAANYRPGLAMDDDGRIYKVGADGTETEIGVPNGGSLPAGSDGQIQFNDGDAALGASPDLAWDGSSNRILLGGTENGGGEIIGGALGVQIHVTGADGDADHVGGEVVIVSGGSAGQNGGDLTARAGADTADGSGGNVTVQAGSSVEGDGGELLIQGGLAPAGQGGQVVVSAGSGSDGGNLTLQGGSPDGNIQAYSGDSNQAWQLDANGFRVLTTKLGFFSHVTVTQPVVPLTTPSVQDVIDALVVLGLVSQSD